jgi:hypothetical protein
MIYNYKFVILSQMLKIKVIGFDLEMKTFHICDHLNEKDFLNDLNHVCSSTIHNLNKNFPFLFTK